MTTETTQPLTREQIEEAVAKGTVTQAQAEQIWANYISETTLEKADQRAETRERTRQLKSEIDRYREALPALTDKESAEFKRVQAEFDRLGSLGFPTEKGKGGEQTELAALLAAFGPQSALRRKTKADDSEPEEAVEVGGGAAPNGSANGSGDAPHPTMSADEKRFYSDMIRQGLLKSWTEANELVTKHGNPALRKRHGAKIK